MCVLSLQWLRQLKVAHTRLPSVGFRNCYQFRCLVNRGTICVNSLPKTVTRQRRGCDLNPGPSAPESRTLTTRLVFTEPPCATQTSLIFFWLIDWCRAWERCVSTGLPWRHSALIGCRVSWACAETTPRPCDSLSTASWRPRRHSNDACLCQQQHDVVSSFCHSTRMTSKYRNGKCSAEGGLNCRNEFLITCTTPSLLFLCMHEKLLRPGTFWMNLQSTDRLNKNELKIVIMFYCFTLKCHFIVLLCRNESVTSRHFYFGRFFGPSQFVMMYCIYIST